MQVSLDLQNQVNRGLLSHKAAEPAPAPEPAQEPTQEKGQEVKSIYFGNGEENGYFRQNAMKILVPLSLLTAAGTMATSCSKDDDAFATASAIASATTNGSVHTSDSVPHVRDTIYKDRYIYVDTGSYHHTVDTIYKWKDDYKRPLPLDTLTKHLVIFGIDSVDSVDKRNVVHFEYDRPWEYNSHAICNMNQLESQIYGDRVLVHDMEVVDYKGQHKYYGKQVRRNVESPILIERYDGTTARTKNGIFLEIRRNVDDIKDANILDTKLETRYFLQTAGDSVLVFKDEGNGKFVEDGRFGKGYLGKNTILMKDLIGRYPTEDHLTNFKVSAINDELLKYLYIRAKDEEEVSGK